MKNLLEAIDGPTVTAKKAESTTTSARKPTREEIQARIAEIRETQSLVAKAIRERIWASRPDLWCEERLEEYVWSKQREILLALQKYRKVAVKSCHEVGKSFISARAIAHWIDTHKAGEAFVVTSAPTAPQIRAILWRELGRAWVAGDLPGRLNQTEWFLDVNGKTEMVAMGRKPDEYDPTAFQGIHAPFVLVVFDESGGIRGGLWEAADSLIANDNSKFLAIGNPDEAGTEFHDICKPGSGWHVIEISAFDSPNFTGEDAPEFVLQQLIGRTYVEEKRRKWAASWIWVDAEGTECDYRDGVRCVPGPEPTRYDEHSNVLPPRSYEERVAETNPLWQSKILGRFPSASSPHALIPLHWITDAQKRNLKPDYSDSSLGVDVGGGGDSSTECHRAGDVFRIIAEHRIPDTMQTTGLVVGDVNRLDAEGRCPQFVSVDVIGIGRGVTDRGKEMHEAGDVRAKFQGINVGEAPKDPKRFVNRRAELWWGVRERFEQGRADIDPKDEDLAGELAEIRFKRQSNGKILIESKDDAKRRGIPSPNRGDALMLSTAPFEERKIGSATWGR